MDQINVDVIVSNGTNVEVNSPSTSVNAFVNLPPPLQSSPPHNTKQSSKTNSDGSSNEAEQVESSGSYQERMFFHLLMILVSSYGAMILTNWGTTSGSPDENNVGKESMWFKIISLWIFMAMFFKSLHASYIDNKNI